jgi:UDP-4-amino-4,6-dideoxy-N-acetyl-beta-L-altrosamine transaminase
MMNFIPYGRQDITDQDLNIVLETLKSDWITQGPMIQKFEKKIADYTGAKFVSALNSATSALHVSLMALGVGRDDIVWTSPITFVASANCALYCNAKISFVDIDPQTFNMSAIELEKKLIKAKENNELPKVVIPVHMTGQSCDMIKIKNLSMEYGFKIVEDASHAIGGEYQNKPVGSCEYSDISVFSFHPVKIVTTAEGGACLTNDETLAKKIELYRSHGVTRADDLMQGKPHGPWYYEQVDLGYNYRMTDIQASLGFSQLDRLDQYIKRRHELVKRYNEKLADVDLEIPFQSKDTYNSFHLYVIKVDVNKRLEIFKKLREANIGVNVHYIPVHTQTYYKELGFKTGDYPVSEEYYSKCISIPMFPTMTEKEQDYICEKLKEFCS